MVCVQVRGTHGAFLLGRVWRRLRSIFVDLARRRPSAPETRRLHPAGDGNVCVGSFQYISDPRSVSV